MKIKLLLAVMAAVLAITVIGCNRSGKEVAVQSTYDDFIQQKSQVKNVTVTLRDILKITLPANPSTGFKWEVAGISDQAVMVQDGEPEYNLPESSAIGAFGQETWTFKPQQIGTCIISMTYSQPWMGGTKNEWTIKAGVTVK
jgi:inhibitor of cysteine peptidase